MNKRFSRWREHGSYLSLVAAATLAIGVIYILGGIYRVPYGGFTFDGQWRVIATGIGCASPTSASVRSWCTQTKNLLRVGDQIAVMPAGEDHAPIPHETYLQRPLLVPLQGLQRGDRVQLQVRRDNETLEIQWPIKGPDPTEELLRLIGMSLFLPFWLAGTVVLLFFRPRNTAWYLLVAFNYLTGLWFIVGNLSVTHVFGSLIMVNALSWMMMAVYLHFHMLVPVPILNRIRKPLLFLLYGGGSVLLVLSLVGAISRSAYSLGLLCGIGGSILILLWRLIRPRTKQARVTNYLMLVGIGLATLPSLLIWLIPPLLGQQRLTGSVLTVLLNLALPALPLFYTYALYKSQLGNMLEVRANRALSTYAFTVIYVTAFIILFVLFYQDPVFDISSLLASLAASTTCLVLTLLAWKPFQRWVNRLAYGAVHEPDQLVRQFANEIPRALNRDHLRTILLSDVLPTLLIRQSALIWFTSEPDPWIYKQNVNLSPSASWSANAVRPLLADASRFLPKDGRADFPFSWVRLVVPIAVDEQTVGAWLLGHRDPDNYYPQSDVELLHTLGNQVAVALETIRLFEISQERSAELAQVNLELRRSNRYKDDLLRNVTHELRTPLAKILGYAELLKLGEGGALTEEQMEMADIIATGANELSQLVSDLIAARQRREATFEGQEVHIARVVQSSVKQMATVLTRINSWQDARHMLRLDVEKAPHAKVWGDPVQLGQMVDNLLQNAIKFSPNGGKIQVKVWVGSHRFSNNHAAAHSLQVQNGAGDCPALLISVRDWGIGMAAEELDKIWLDFYQIDASATRHFGGTGIGLALVKDVVELHKGDVWVTSQPNEGTTFTVALPCRPAPALLAEETQPPDSEKAPEALHQNDSTAVSQF